MPVPCAPKPTWVAASHGNIPPGAVLAGTDVDDTPLYAGRARFEGDLLPAKVSPSHGCAFISYDYAEHVKLDYEVLCNTRVDWVQSSNGNVPPNAVVVGETNYGEKLYMGRAKHSGALTPGKIHPSHGVLYIPFRYAEKHYKEYEVMVHH